MRNGFDFLLIAAIVLLPLLAWFFSGSSTQATPVVVGENPTVEKPVDLNPGVEEEVPAVVEVPPPPSTSHRWLLRSFLGGESISGGLPMPLVRGGGDRLISGPDGNLEVELGAEHQLLLSTVDGSRQPLQFPETAGELDCNLYENPGADSPVAVDFIGLARPLDFNSPGRLIITGETILPPGSQVRINVMAMGRTLDGGIAEVSGPVFSWDSMTAPRNWFGGEYQLRISWRPSGATPELIAQVTELHPSVGGGDDWTSEKNFCIGDPVEAERQRLLIESYYFDAILEVTRSRDLLLVAGARARGKRSKLLRDIDRVEEMEAHPFADELLKLGGRGNFAIHRWRKLIDEKLPQRWQELGDSKSIPFADKHPGAARNLSLLFATLYKYARLESTVTYEALGLNRHENDFVANFDWGPETERKQVLDRIRNYISAIEESVGLDD